MLPRMTLCLVAALLPFGPARAADPQASEPSAVIARGFDALKTGGADKAIEAWLKGSPIEGDPNAKSQSALIGQIATIYGPYDSFEIVRTDALGSRSKVLYAAAHFAKGDAFCKFLLFKTQAGHWVLTMFFFHTNPDVVWPSSIAQ